MRKNAIFLTLILLLIFFSGYLLYERNNEKIVVINSDKVLKNYSGFKEAQDEYEKKIESYQTSFNKQNGLLKAKKSDLKKNEKLFSKQKKESKKKEIITLQNKLIQLESAIKSKTKEEEDKLLKGVYNKVNDFIKRYCEVRKIKIVIGANGSGNVVYNSEVVDKTEEVITLLNKEYANGVN